MKTILKNIAAAVLLVAPILSNAQVATRLQFPNPTKMVEFGYSVTEYEGYSLFGSEFRNAVNVYQNGTFKFQAVGPLESNFGHAIGMNRDYIAVGAYQANNRRGVVYLSKSINGQAQNNFNTIISAQTPVNNDQFGKAIDIHNEWMVIAAPNVNGAEHSGYIELWKLVNGTWARNSVIRNTSLPANAEFGNSVAIRGDRVVVGAPGINKVFIYRLLNNAWVLEKTYEPNAPTWANTSFDHLNMPVYSMRFGYDVDITDNNIIVGDPTSAKAAILTLQNGNWVLTKTLLPPASLFTKQTFGNSVAIQYNRAVVGAPRSAGGGINRPDEGKAYFYTEGYNYKGYMYVGNPSNMRVMALGMGVAIDQDNVLVGASNSDNFLTTLNEGGAFRMPFHFVSQSGNWRAGDADEIGFASADALVFPNPAIGNEVEFNSLETVISAEAVSVIGEVFALNTNLNTITVGALPKGVYTLKITTESGNKFKKFIKE